jgi:hypothetical protein
LKGEVEVSTAVRWLVIAVAVLAVIAMVALADGSRERRSDTAAPTWTVRL